MPLLESSQNADARAATRLTTFLPLHSAVEAPHSPVRLSTVSASASASARRVQDPASDLSMGPQRTPPRAACSPPPVKKRANSIVIVHGSGGARSSGVRAGRKPMPLALSPGAFSPPCTKHQPAPMVSPATRVRVKRKLMTSPSSATVIETRIRSSRRVNRRIFEDPTDDPPTKSSPSEQMLMIQPRILPLPDIFLTRDRRNGAISAMLSECASRGELLMIQPRILPLPGRFTLREPATEAAETTVAPSEDTQTIDPPTVSPVPDLPEGRDPTREAVESVDSDPPNEDAETILPLSGEPDVCQSTQAEVYEVTQDGEVAMNAVVQQSEEVPTEEVITARTPMTPPVREESNTPEEQDSGCEMLLSATDEDALASDEDWWDMTYTQHDLAGSNDDPARPVVEVAAAPTPYAHYAHGEARVWKWTPQLKREAFTWILFYLNKHLEIGRERECAALIRYLEMPQSVQGLFVCGISPQSTGTIIRSLLDSLDGTFGGRRLDVTVVKGELYSSSEEIYSSVRARLKCKWDLPPWRRIDEFMQRGETVPALDPNKLSVVVLENIDPHVKAGDSRQPALDRLLRFLNAHVFARGLKFIVIGHEAKTIRRFSRQFGGFWFRDVDQYVLRLPQYTVSTLTAHIEAVIWSAVATMVSANNNSVTHPLPTGSSLLNDLFAPKVVQFAAQKALKQKQCELEPVLMILRRALVRMLSACRYRSDQFETDVSRWRLRYEHVAAVTTEYFKHDYVHRIQCVGVIPQAVLLVLIDAGPCTEEQLFQHVWERRLVHSWIMVVTTFRSTMFDQALELLLSVPVVKKRETKVFVDGECRVVQLLHALPTREHLIEAAGKKERIKLLL